MDSNFKLQFCFPFVICVFCVFGNQGALSDSYTGCFNDNSTDAVFTQQHNISNLTPDACRKRCSTDDNRYIGLWGGINCWCSHLYIETLIVKLNDSRCSSRCIGNRSLFCGGARDSTIYSVYSVCPKGTYGSECKKLCNCKDNNSCTASGICPKLDCAPGWTLNMSDDPNRRRCSVDVNECERECNSVNKSDCYSCSLNEECNNTEGNFECKCKNGYRRSGRVCQDINECAKDNGNCQYFCNNTVGSFHCSCWPGYRSIYQVGAKYNCTDIDECSENPLLCEHKCKNINGGYICSCHSGFYLDRNNHSCNDVDECFKLPSLCEHNCLNTYGNYSCRCREGYRTDITDRHRCIDIDECSERTSNCQHMCHNTEGSYNCSCYSGYELTDDLHGCSDKVCVLFKIGFGLTLSLLFAILALMGIKYVMKRNQSNSQSKEIDLGLYSDLKKPNQSQSTYTTLVPANVLNTDTYVNVEPTYCSVQDESATATQHLKSECMGAGITSSRNSYTKTVS